MKKLILSLFVFLTVAGAAMAQNRTITGTVTAKEDGKPLPGVSVRIKGASGGISTNANGKYSLVVPSGGIALEFSFIGYFPQAVAIGSSDVINASLASNAKELGEVVVVAYGTQKKTSFTGSASTISSEMLTKAPVTDFTKALEGTSPGLQVTNGGGQPGSNATIRIRGFGSVNASSNPLIVLDGAAYDGDLSSIATNDIESVTLLKDATATSLYGARGANGVVVVTTKRGKIGAPKLSLSLRGGLVNRSMKDYKRIDNEKDYYELTWEAYRNQLQNVGGQSAVLAGQNASKNLVAQLGGYNSFNVPNANLVDPVTGKLNPNAQLRYHDDWNDAIIQTGVRQDYNLNVSGATDKSDYYVSLGYLDDKGILKYTRYKRYNGRVNVNANATDWLKAGLNISGAYAKQNASSSNNSTATVNPFYTNRLLAPIYPVYVRDQNNNFVEDPKVGGNQLDYGGKSKDGVSMGNRPFAGQSNSLGTLSLDRNYSDVVTGNGVAFLEARFLKDFTIRTNINAQYNNQYSTFYNNTFYGQFGPPTYGAGSKNSDNTFSYTFNQLLNYTKTFGKNHIDVLAGHENYSWTNKVLYASRQTFPVPYIDDLDIASVAGGSGSYTNVSKIESYLSRVNYDYDNKYFLSGSFRRDGSSRFYKDSRWGNFWSLGGAWRVSQEDFLKDSNWLNELKAKFSYGEQGNEALIGRDGNPLYYGWQGLYDLSVSNGTSNGGTVSTLENRTLQWEKSKNLNAGIEFGLFDNRLTGSFDYFDRKSDNLLFQTPYPSSTGITYRFENIGAMKNYGFELNLGGDIIRSTDFKWNAQLNLTRLRNKITKLPTGQDKIISGNKQLMVGKSIYEFFLVESAGVDAKNGDELYYKNDANGNRVTTNNYNDAVNNNGRVYAGSSIPDLYGGLTNNFSYKGFDFSFLVSFGLGGKYYDGTYAVLMSPGNFGQTWSTDMLDRWTPSNPNASLPRLETGNVNIGRASTRFLTNASYLNIKNAVFGYNIPKSTVTSLGISALRVYVSGDNLGLFSKRQGMDPQSVFGGTSGYTYVPVRTVSFGLNVTF